MTTLYMKSPDERVVGSFRIKPTGSLMRASTALKRDEGWIEITPQEFRRLKAQIMRRMLRPENPRPLDV